MRALKILHGEGTESQINTICINAAIFLLLARKAKSLDEGFSIARDVIKTKKAWNLFLNVVFITTIYRDNFKNIFITVLLLYSVEILFELVYSFIFLIVNSNSYIITSINSLVIRNLFSILVVLNLILTLSIKSTKKFLNKILYLIIDKQAVIVRILLIIFYLFIIYIIIIYTININIKNYYNNLVSSIIILSCMTILIKYKNKI